MRVREAWRSDRRRLATAHAEGARSAARIRQELETLLQVLDTPLLLCDHHRRLLLFNQAAESLFEENPGLGLGKRLDTLLPVTSLQDAIGQLLEDGSPRELLIPCDERWLHAVLRRVPLSNGETLLTLTDATAAWNSEMGARAELAERLPPLRRHGASLSSAAEALGSARHAGRGDDALRARLETVIEEESRALGQALEGLGRLIEDMQQQGERLVPLWSNDLWQSLNERLGDDPLQVVPIGMPAWFKGDAPALLALLESLLAQLRQHTGHTTFEGEMLLGNRRVYLDLVWRGTPLAQRELAAWSERRLDSLPLSPRVGDLLRQHASDTWSLADADGIHARLRLPLPSVERVGAPREALPPRPEFHDFGIADLPPPDAELARCPLRALEVVAFDTETTGLELRRGDTVISIGACRIVNARLLASEVFDVRVDPGKPIPPASTAIHGLTDDDVMGAPAAGDPAALSRLHRRCGDSGAQCRLRSPCLAAARGQRHPRHAGAGHPAAVTRAGREPRRPRPRHPGGTLRPQLPSRHAPHGVGRRPGDGRAVAGTAAAARGAWHRHPGARPGASGQRLRQGGRLHMNEATRQARLVALVALALLLFTPPMVLVFDRANGGLSWLPLYLFAAWGLVLGLAAWLLEHWREDG